MRTPLSQLFREPRLGLVVTQHAQHFQIDDDAIAIAVAIACREVAIDAAADLAAFRPHRDALGDVQCAVLADAHLDVVAQDALFRERAAAHEHREQYDDDARDHCSCTCTDERSSSRAW